MTIKQQIRNLSPVWLINFYHLLQAVAANIAYGFPARKMRVTAITGTNGKTTSCFFLASILRAAGRKVGMLTTVRFTIGSQIIANDLNMTTVNPFLLQKYLKKMLQHGCTDIVLETTSHAIDQHRIWGINFTAIGITNITHDHLDYHGTFAGYIETKKRLFTLPHKVSVLNRDDESFEQFEQTAVGKKIVYALEHKDVDVTARKILSEPGGTAFTIISSAGQQAVGLKVPGGFNVLNALCATSLALGLDIPLSYIKKGLEDVAQVPGRMEKVNVAEAKGRLNFSVIIDYAHTPDALEKAFAAIRPAVKGKLIAVYGATGDRDKAKRPVLGEIGGRMADIVFITDEEPYTEEPGKIIEAVAEGVPKGATKERPKELGKTFFKIQSRMDAIGKAIDMAGSGDIVFITGMGDQSYKVIGSQKVPWSDRDVVQAMLRKKLAADRH